MSKLRKKLNLSFSINQRLFISLAISGMGSDPIGDNIDQAVFYFLIFELASLTYQYFFKYCFSGN